MQQPNVLFPASRGKNVSMYDNSQATLAFTYFGDFEKAEKIFDFFFSSRLHSEMLASPGGFAQIVSKKLSKAYPYWHYRKLNKIVCIKL